MIVNARPRWATAHALLLAVLLAAGCGTAPTTGPGSDPAAGPTVDGPVSGAPTPDPSCAAFARYGDLSGTTVTVVATAPDPNDPDPAAPNPAGPNSAASNPAVPTSAAPNPAAPNPAAPNPAAPDSAVPGPAAPDPAVPDPAVPDPAVPDPAVPDPAAPDSTVSGAGPALGRRIGGFTPFTRCTGARVEVSSAPSLAARLDAGGPPPDLGYLPDSAALAELVRRTGAVRPVPPPVAANVAEFYPETYRAAGSVDGTLYAAPLDGSVKSLVWYSPREFAARGYRVPASWPDLLALTRRIAADGAVPWCAGAADGPASGGALVDALEETVLGGAGPEVFDAWVAHTIPTDAPQIGGALDELGLLTRDPAFGNAGFGPPESIATTPVHDAGLPVAGGRCFLHRQSDRYAEAWPAGTAVAPDGDVFAFPLPPHTPETGPTALVDGGFVVALSGRREVAALQAYLSTPDAADAMARELGPGWLSPNSGLDPDAVAGPVQRLALGVLQDPRTTLRYDGSDRMPAAVGAGTLPRALLAWITGTPTADALAAAEAGWPR